MGEENRALHTLAIVLGIVAAVFIGLALVLYLGYATSAQLDGITQAEATAYGAIAVVGAVASEFGAREL